MVPSISQKEGSFSSPTEVVGWKAKPWVSHGCAPGQRTKQGEPPSETSDASIGLVEDPRGKAQTEVGVSSPCPCVTGCHVLLPQNKPSSESAVSSTVNPIVIHKRSKVKTEAEGLRPASPLILTQVTCWLSWLPSG